jgi:hypothetical protein
MPRSDRPAPVEQRRHHVGPADPLGAAAAQPHHPHERHAVRGDQLRGVQACPEGLVAGRLDDRVDRAEVDPEAIPAGDRVEQPLDRRLVGDRRDPDAEDRDSVRRRRARDRRSGRDGIGRHAADARAAARASAKP